MGRALIGQTGLVDGLLIALLCHGHVLVEGVPGLAKTTAVRSFARVLGLSFLRVQFTPDLLPADVLGTQVYEPATGELVGGLYGVQIGRLFAGESMFHAATDASKVSLVHLVDWLRATGATLLDVQWRTDHLASLGVIQIPRSEYLELLAEAVA